MESFVTLALIVVAILLFAYLYKKRATVANWLNEPELVDDKAQRRMKLAHYIEELNYRYRSSLVGTIFPRVLCFPTTAFMGRRLDD